MIDDPVNINFFVMMDVDKHERMMLHFDDNSMKIVDLDGLGDNSKEDVVVNEADVTKVEIVITGSGAVSAFEFCTPCDGEPRTGGKGGKGGKGSYDSEDSGLDLDGPKHLGNLWGASSGYLNQEGVPKSGKGGGYDPADGVNVLAKQDTWWSMQWELKPEGDFYRIKNRWSGQFLTRSGKQLHDGSWAPGNHVWMSDYEDWSSQLWEVEEAADGHWAGPEAFRFINQWDPSTGFLNRNGVHNGHGWDPSSSLGLQSRHDDWGSLMWKAYSV